MFYTLFAISVTGAGILERVEALHLTQAECTKRAKYLIAEVYDGARCSPETPTDSKATFRLPSGRVIKLERVDGKWTIPDNLLPSDRRLVDELTSPIQKF